MVENPIRPASPCAGEGVAGRSQRSPQQIVLRIPISEIAPEQHREHNLRVIGDKVRSVGDTRRAGIRAGPASVAPKIAVGGQASKPVRTRKSVGRTKESRKIAPAVYRQGFAGGQAEMVVDPTTPLGGDQFIPEVVIFVQVLTQ